MCRLADKSWTAVAGLWLCHALAVIFFSQMPVWLSLGVMVLVAGLTGCLLWHRQRGRVGHGELRSAEVPIDAGMPRVDAVAICGQCGAYDLQIFYTGTRWGAVLCEACYAAQSTGGPGVCVPLDVKKL